MKSMTFAARIAEHDACLSDEELVCELRCAERCARCSTRTRRDVALLHLRCARLEFERRAALQVASPTLA